MNNQARDIAKIQALLAPAEGPTDRCRIENHVKVYIERRTGDRSWIVSAESVDRLPLDGCDDGDYTEWARTNLPEAVRHDLDMAVLPTARELLFLLAAALGYAVTAHH